MSVLAIFVSGLTLMAALILGVMGLSGLSRPGADRRRAGLMLLVSIITLLNLYLWLTGPSHAPDDKNLGTVEQTT
ncbi:MAG: hypothetical protein IH996_04720 [Proteobacteria bacterium]|nr:hypothetical protein [Pseudomonadota bacterium]